MQSIWKDYYANLGTSNSIYYRIGYMAGSTFKPLYTGRAYKRPDASAISVKVNDVVADFLGSLATMPSADFNAITFPVTIKVQTSTNGTSWTDKVSDTFIQDWSYAYGVDPSSSGIAAPIRNHIDSRQWMLYSAISGSTVTVKYVKTTGSSGTYSKSIAITSAFCASSGSSDNDMIRSLRSAGKGTMTYKASDITPLKTLTIAGYEYRVVTSCAKYVLYYKNAFGGWDQLLIEGNTTEHDDLTRYTTEGEYNNNASDKQLNRGTRNYVNEVVKGYTVNTGTMTEDEASRMWHLVNSTDVYLYSFAQNLFIPVVITNSTCEYKTFHGEGNSAINYELELQVADTRTRR